MRKIKIQICVLVTVLRALSSAGAEFVLQSIYDFPPANYGANPQNRLLEGPAGVFYSTTWYGGSYSNGTIYRITSSGVLTYLHSFDATNGWHPWGDLAWGDDGLLYGITRNHVRNQQIGHGLIFRCSTNGDFSVLFEFQGTNGSKPVGPLAKASDGSFYGVTAYGGEYNVGTAFKVTTNGVLNVITSLDGTIGNNPRNGLVAAPDGCIYGAMEVGGSNDVGTLIKICDGQVTKLVDFGGALGSFPVGGLTVGYDQNLYGATAHGGSTTNYGTFFRVQNGVFSILGSFDPIQGNTPSGGVVQGSDGHLYGVMTYGSFLFKVSPAGILTPMQSLGPIYPQAVLTASRDGTLFGCLTDLHYPFSVPPGAIFRLVEAPKITSLIPSNGSVTLNWTSFTNGVYQIQYKPSLGATGWTPRPTAVTATGESTSFLDFPITNAGFYRVVLLP